jgi:hypothetical protein
VDGGRRKKLVSAVKTFGSHHWAEITEVVPGQNESQCLQKWHNMPKKTAADAQSAPKTNAALLAQVAGLEVGPDLHVFPPDSQKFLALLGITTGQSLLESHVEYLVASFVGWRCETVSLDDARASIREWKSRLVLDPAEPDGIHDDSISVNVDADADHPSGYNKAAEDFGDNMPSDETATDGCTSGDEPPGKRRRFDWV